MMLYLTGAKASLIKSGGVSPQTDVNKSLGGYVSSSPVPNGALNNVFDLISSYTLENKPTETLAFALINKFDKPAKNVTLKIVTDEGHLADFQIAAVAVDSNTMIMEHIANRYQEPIEAQFYDASFYRAAVNVEIVTPANKGEEIIFYPMNVKVEVEKDGIEGTWEAIYDAFADDDTYIARRLTDKIFRIERRDEMVLSTPVECSYITTEGATFKFDGKMLNKADNSVIISEEFLPGACIGLWVKRKIKQKGRYPSNEQLLENYKNGFNYSTIEEIDIVLEYDMI